MDKFTKLLKERSGNVAIMGAIAMPVLITAAAFAVDHGSLYFERREAQSITDLAAISAAADIASAGEVALATFRDNGFGNAYLADDDETPAIDPAREMDGDRIVLEMGRYVPDPSVAVGVRFQPGGEPSNAVRVTLTKSGTLHFGAVLMDPPLMSTTAVASASAVAAFSAGSRLLRLDGGILNAVLNGLLGTNLSLSVMDYEALVKADVEVLSFIDALATELKLTAGTYDDVLDASASTGQVARALSKASKDRGVQAVLSTIAASVSDSEDFPLDGLFNLGEFGFLQVGQDMPAFSARAAIMDILTASAAIADGTNQVKLNLGATVPGLAGLEVDLAIGEPPQGSSWFAIGPAGEMVHTAQTRLRLTTQIGGQGLLSGVGIRLPIYVELAYAEARLNSVACPTGRPESAVVSVLARPGIAGLWIGEVDTGQFSRFTSAPTVAPAKLVETPLISATGSSRVQMGNESFSKLSFNAREIEAAKIKRASTNNFTEYLTKFLLKQLDLKVSIESLTLGSPDLVKNALVETLGAVTPTLDAVLYNLLTAVGVKVGEVDIRVTEVKCQRAVLVQ